MNSSRVLLLFAILALAGCATWQAPPPFDESDFRRRSAAGVIEGGDGSADVEVRALVLAPADSERLLGADVSVHGVEPVWIEIDNRSDKQLVFLHSGADPDYFSPLEVSWLLHGGLLGGGNDAVDRHIHSLAFPRGVIPPGQRHSGLIFTNPSPGSKMINIDLLGDDLFLSTTLFPTVPNPSGELTYPVRLRAPGDVVEDHDTEAALKQALEHFYGSVAEGADLEAPLTTVIVGWQNEVSAAFGRRGYRRLGPAEKPQQLMGRAADARMKKWSQAGTPGNWSNIWALPFTFRGRPVLVAQTGAPRGGRFASGLKKPTPDPAADYLRDLLVEDMLFADALVKLAIFEPAANTGFATVTDGRVAVLFFGARGVGPQEAWITDWSETAPIGEFTPYDRAGNE